jgi:hypothetical protein
MHLPGLCHFYVLNMNGLEGLSLEGSPRGGIPIPGSEPGGDKGGSLMV